MMETTLTKEQLKRIQQLELEAVCELDRICEKYQLKYGLAYGTLIGAVRHQGFIPWDDDVDVVMLREDYNKLKEVCKQELSEGYFYQTQATDPEYFHVFDKIRIDGTVFKEGFMDEYNIHHGVYIDIFPMDHVPANVFLRKLHYYRYQFYRVGLMVKYMNIDQREGKKKMFAKILRGLYKTFSLEALYHKAERVATKYNAKKTSWLFSFGGSVKEDSLCKAEVMENTIKTSFEGKQLSIPQGYHEMLKALYGDYMQLPPEEDRVPKHQLVELQL